MAGRYWRCLHSPHSPCWFHSGFDCSVCTEVKEKVTCLFALDLFSFASFFSFYQSLKSCLALQVSKRRKWTSQGRAAEVMKERTGKKKKAIKKEEGNRSTQSCGHWSNMVDKEGRKVISALLILFLLLGPIQHSLQPMQWQKHYFKDCLFSNQLLNRRFSSLGLCLAPGGHLWLLQPSDCAAIQEQKRPGQMPKKEMLLLLSPEVFPNPHLSLASAYEKEMTLEGRGHLCLFQKNFDSYAILSMERKALKCTNT